jgi:hypothetical protein
MQFRSKEKIFWPLRAFGKQIMTQIPNVCFTIDVFAFTNPNVCEMKCTSRDLENCCVMTDNKRK